MKPDCVDGDAYEKATEVNEDSKNNESHSHPHPTQQNTQEKLSRNNPNKNDVNR